MSSFCQQAVAADGSLMSIAQAELQGCQLRKACDPCRLRKLKCEGMTKDALPCLRCRSENLHCVFCAYLLLTAAVRSRIGRPPKRQCMVSYTPSENTQRCKAPYDALLSLGHENGGPAMSAEHSVGVNARPTKLDVFSSTTVPRTTDVAHNESPSSEMSMFANQAPTYAQPAQENVFLSPDFTRSSLSDLSLAAFLESLYELEIAPPPDMLTGLTAPPTQDTTLATNAGSSGLAYAQGAVQGAADTPPTTAPLQEYAESAFMQDNLAFSVPADMRWWNTAWLFPAVANSQPSVKFERGAMDASAAVEPNNSRSLPADHGSHNMGASDNHGSFNAAATALDHCCGTSAPARPLEGAPSCCGKAEPRHNNDAYCDPRPLMKAGSGARPSKSKKEKVHCVPNPAGTQCSCKCNSVLALVSLERSLRQSFLERDCHQENDNKKPVVPSLVFTLSMSQSVSEQCNCSSDCPTCKTDQSYKSSASLLISTALQIYARALQVFEEVLLSSNDNKCSCAAANGAMCPCSAERKKNRLPSGESSIEVKIGDYVPSVQSARKIALYAMKLELLNLEQALSRVHSASQQPLSATAMLGSGHHADNHSAREDGAPSSLRLNPIDQLVIQKLHSQLNDVLHAVETMELRETRTLP